MLSSLLIHISRLSSAVGGNIVTFAERATSPTSTVHLVLLSCISDTLSGAAGAVADVVVAVSVAEAVETVVSGAVPVVDTAVAVVSGTVPVVNTAGAVVAGADVTVEVSAEVVVVSAEVVTAVEVAVVPRPYVCLSVSR